MTVRSARLGPFLLPTSVALLACAVAAAAQEVEVVRRPSVCEGCEIVLERASSLQDSPETPFGANVTAIAWDGDGRIYVPSRTSPGEMYVFDTAGRHLRTVGRRGDGPGEYRVINEVQVGEEDTLLVFDNGLARMTVLSPSLDVVRTVRLPVPIRPTEVALTPEGSIVASGRVASPAAAGLPLHVVDPAGRLERSFGADEPTAEAQTPFGTSRALAIDGEGRVWAAMRTSYRLQRWTLQGRRELDLDGGATWFDPWTVDEPLGPASPPRPWIQALRVDRQGRVWVLVRVSASGFAESLMREDTPNGTFHRIGNFDHAFDTVIEVIDPEEKRLLASLHVDAYLTNFVGEDGVLGVREDELDVPILDIWRVRLGAPKRTP